MAKIEICKLVEDFDIYPRGKIDTTHVASMIDAEEAGTSFPALVADKQSLRLIDGFHRKRMYQKRYGNNHKVEVILKSYPNLGAMFEEACQANAMHGRRLALADKVRCVAIGKKLGLSLDRIANGLQLTKAKAGELVQARTAVGEQLEQVTLKTTIAHMAGRTLTPQQVEANDRLGGMKPSYFVNQIITLLENDLWDPDDLKLLQRFKRLYQLLGQVLKE